MSVIYKNGTYYGAGGGGEGADTEIIADDFDDTESYAVGDYVVYEGDLYKCTTAHTGAWDASDFDATQVMEEMPTPMPAEDMSDIVTPKPGVMSRRFKYSTEEQVVGEWIDGKPLYQKTWSVVKTVSSGASTTLFTLSGVDTSIMVSSFMIENNNKFMLPDSNCRIKIDSSGNVIANTSSGSSFSNATWYITLQYTKTTD